MSDERAIEIRQLAVRHQALTVLDIGELRLTEGRVGVIGANGSGKSTLLRCLNGLVAPTSGRVRVDGVDVARDTRRVRRKVGFVFQDPEAQIVMPTIAEEMDLGLKAQGIDALERRRRAADALERFGLQGRGAQSAHLLSGGEKRRLALACILAMQPDILVMDEPTTMLDLPGRRQFRRLIEPLPQRILIATHDLELLRGFERVIVLDHGRVHVDAGPDAAIESYVALVDAREAAMERAHGGSAAA